MISNLLKVATMCIVVSITKSPRKSFKLGKILSKELGQMALTLSDKKKLLHNN